MYNHYSMGKYHYKSLPMGIRDSPEIFQEKMDDFFHGFEFICVYIEKLWLRKRYIWKDY